MVDRLADAHPDGRWIVAVTRVVNLRAVGDHREYVTFGAELDVVAWLRQSVRHARLPVLLDRYGHEEVDIAHDCGAPKAELRKDRREVGIAGLSCMHAVAQEVVGIAAASINRIVAPHRVGRCPRGSRRLACMPAAARSRPMIQDTGERRPRESPGT